MIANELSARILIADDDQDLLAVVGFALEQAGFDIFKVTTGMEALAMTNQHHFSLLALDINMPEMNGIEVCTQVRKRSNVPVMMLSARDQERDLLDALEAGADAYMVKPFSPRALIARVRALLRRKAFSDSMPTQLQCGHLLLDVTEHLLRCADIQIHLTRLETKLLQLLMLHAGQTLSTQRLLSEVWDSSNATNRNMLKQMVFRLRRKLAGDLAAANALRTSRDGYEWDADSVPRRATDTTHLSDASVSNE